MNYELNRKIPSYLEDPVDNLIIGMVERTNYIFNNIGFTPNVLTFISLIFYILAIWSLYKTYNKSYVIYFLLVGIFIALAYIFDCYDGNYARTYKMSSEFGAKFDLYKDITSELILGLVLLGHPLVKPIDKIIFCIIAIALFSPKNLVMYLTSIYQKYDCKSENSEICNEITDKLATNRMGCGTVQLFYVVFTMYLYMKYS